MADWGEQCSPAYGQGGKLNVRTGYLQLLWASSSPQINNMKRSLLLREKLSLFSLCRSLDELQEDWGSLECLVGGFFWGFISRWSWRNSFEISLHKCLPNSHCCLLEFWADNIKDEFKDKICLKIFVCWRHPLLMIRREICRNSAFPVFNIHVQVLFLKLLFKFEITPKALWPLCFMKKKTFCFFLH